jgi:RNA polymerase sigma-70 factor (ECF subfamily)
MIETKSLQQLALDFVDTRSEKSFTLLYNRLKPGLKKHIQRYHQDSDVVDELLAITLSKAYTFADKYDSRWNFSTWVYKICQNECLMEIRRQNATYSLDNMIDNKISIKPVNSDDWQLETDYEFFADEETVQSDSLYSEVLEEIKNLPQHYKEIIEDRILHKMKYKDIAEKRGLLINTVRSRIHSAKKVIKNLWIDKKLKCGSSKTINIVGVTILQLLDDKDTKKSKPTTETPVIITNIIINNAKYGAGETWIDVTEKASTLFESKKEIKVGNRLGGDPCHGIAKSLILNYNIDDENFTVTLKEGKTFKG